jgi:hypothetical protein
LDVSPIAIGVWKRSNTGGAHDGLPPSPDTHEV